MTGMNKIDDKGQSWQLFPKSRFDLDFPLALWFAGLWFYLKSFLYVCYLYMLGLDPPPGGAPARHRATARGRARLRINRRGTALSFSSTKRWTSLPASRPMVN